MTKPIAFGKLDVKVVPTMEKTHAVPEPETPFRIAILGDFSGSGNCGLLDSTSALTTRGPLLVDRDNLDEVMAKFNVEVNLSIAGTDSPPVTITIRFTELDDFHPDQIYGRVEAFRALRQTRKKLEDPSTYAEGIKELKNVKGPDLKAVSQAQQVLGPNVSEPVKGDLLDQVLEETQGTLSDKSSLSDISGWNSFLQEIVRPHLVPDTDPRQAELIAGVNEAIAELMRKILHHPEFQAIEAAWRGVHFLVSRLETDAQLKLFLFDMSKAELANDLNCTEDLSSTATYKLLVEQTVRTFGGQPWAVLAGNYTFDQTREDAELLGRMAKIASCAGAPFISAASDNVLGCASLANTPDPDDWQPVIESEETQAWEALRGLMEARYLGLALPRFLLRLPYGVDTDPTEQFDFEEMPSDTAPDHDHYLWGNPSFASIFLLARAFSHHGWDLQPGIIQDIEGLPLHVYKELGESQLKPCAEVVLSERAAEMILDKGLMPLLSFRNRDRVRLARFQSFSYPSMPLAGRWG